MQMLFELCLYTYVWKTTCSIQQFLVLCRLDRFCLPWKRCDRVAVVKPRMPFEGKRKKTHKRIKRCDDLLTTLVLFSLYSLFSLVFIWHCIVSLIVIRTPHKSDFICVERCSIPCHTAHSTKNFLNKNEKGKKISDKRPMNRTLTVHTIEKHKIIKKKNGERVQRVAASFDWFTWCVFALAIFMMNHLRKML